LTLTFDETYNLVNSFKQDLIIVRKLAYVLGYHVYFLFRRSLTKFVFTAHH